MSFSHRKRRVPRAVRRNRFLYHLFYEPLFLAAMGVFLFLLLAIGIFLPKIWIVTPRDFSPVVKVRGLDFVQAASLRRNAKRLVETANFKEAMPLWRAAVENNRGDPQTIRLALTNVIQISPPPKEWMAWSVQNGAWLVRLAHTNQADVALFGQVLDHFGMGELVLSVMGPYVDNLRADQIGPYLRSLFLVGRMERFAEVWQRFEQGLANDTDLQLYRVAYLAGWGPAQTAAEARRTLMAARAESATGTLATRLLLSVCVARNDVETYRTSLGQLENSHVDRLQDHVRYWLLLTVNRRLEEARELAHKYTSPPVTAADAELMAKGLVQLGLRPEATEFLDRYWPQFEYSPMIWVLRGQLMIENGKWEDLYDLAANIRQRERLVQVLGGYADYLSGLSEFHQGRQLPANEYFGKLDSHPIADPVLAYGCAMMLKKLGKAEIAAGMLSKLEESFRDRIDFWLQLQSAAYESRQFDMLLTATRKAYEIAPNKLEYLNNYAAALLVSREHSGEAIELTLRALQVAPRAFETRINHALALLQNSRLDEAEPILHDLDDERRDSERDTLVSLGWFEFHFRKNDASRALEAASRVQDRYLLPPQAEWFKQSRRKLEAKPN